MNHNGISVVFGNCCKLRLMFLEVLEERGARPLLELLEKLGGWPVLMDNWDQSEFDWIWLMAQLRLYNNDVLISEWVGPDIKNSDEYIIQVNLFIYRLNLSAFSTDEQKM